MQTMPAVLRLPQHTFLFCFLLALTASLSATAGEPAAAAAPSPPNILWIVWDTVRADRLGVYGYNKPTTPKLDRWAKNARVFENVTSSASSTTPSHAAMFTGLLPSQHGANSSHRWLEDDHVTLAELLADAGYGTYLWAANPHVSTAENFQQGFDHEAHPWDPVYKEEAIRIVTEKLRGDHSSELGRNIQKEKKAPWAIKAAGELAQIDLLKWLEERDSEKPFFAFINYMEAHRPFIPSRSARAKMMSPEQVSQSYLVDRSWVPMWSYTFGLKEYTEEELEIMALTYDATLTELDQLFAELLASLEAAGQLEDTAVILTADHGEHLGEHHMLDHQYSLYGPLINVPLILHYPQRVEQGRESRPVMNYDVFPTILELASIEPPATSHSLARSLLDPDPNRKRLAEYPAVFKDGTRVVRRLHPDFDLGPYSRRLRALQVGQHKLIWGEDGEHQLYDLSADPSESNDLYVPGSSESDRMLGELEAFMKRVEVGDIAVQSPAPELDAEQREMLKGLGYVIEDSAEDAPSPAPGPAEAKPE